jgi:general secretion pathway protein M
VFNHIDQLEKREKLFLFVGTMFVILLIGFYGIYQPYQEVLLKLDKKISIKQLQIKEIRNLQVEYQSIQKQMDQAYKMLTRTGSLSPLTKIESLTSNIVSREKLNYIRPQPPQIQGDIRVDNLDIKLEKLSLEQVLQLLWQVESTKSQMQVKNFRLKQRFDNASELDLTMTVSVYSKSST